MQKLISIITPTYNYGHLIHRLFDSILQQTYNDIEMIIIDDGSADNTKQVIDEYNEKFIERGFSLNYLYQKNQKQAVAINNGLKLIKGDYLVWPDADDWYAEPDALEIMATALDGTNNETSCCRSLAYFLDEKLNIIGSTKHSIPDQLFMDCLLTRNFTYTPGFTMLKTSVLFHEIDNRTIYTGSVEKNYFGQNWQLLLPVFYNYKCITIDKYLFNIYVNENSDSRKNYSYEEQLEKNQMYCDALESVLKGIKNMSNKRKIDLIHKTKNKYNKNELLIHFYFGNKNGVRRSYKKMVSNHMLISLNVKLRYVLSFVPLGYTGWKILRTVKYHMCDINFKEFRLGK